MIQSKNIYQITAFVIILGLILPMWGCYSEEFPGRPTVALVVKTLNNPFFNDMQEGAENMARELEINLIVQAAEREVDVEQQVQIVENLIQRRVDAILLTPSGSREVVPVISRANRVGCGAAGSDRGKPDPAQSRCHSSNTQWLSRGCTRHFQGKPCGDPDYQS